MDNETPVVPVVPGPTASDHPVAAEGVDTHPKTDDKPNLAVTPLPLPTAAAQAQPTLMTDKTDPASTHVAPKGLEDPGEDHSFDNRNTEGAKIAAAGGVGNSNTLLHSGNAMGGAVQHPDAEFQKQFGMPKDVHDPHRGTVPPGQVNAVANKDRPIAEVQPLKQTSGFPTQTEPSLTPVAEKKPTKYLVVINPTSLEGKSTIRFTNGNDFAEVAVGREVEVSEPIYHAIKDSSIPFTARPK